VLVFYLKVLIGNKTDLASERVITTQNGQDAATAMGIPFIETSAKTGDNIQTAFETLIRNTPRPGQEYKVRVDSHIDVLVFEQNVMLFDVKLTFTE